jgi:hypothetical protein
MNDSGQPVPAPAPDRRAAAPDGTTAPASVPLWQAVATAVMGGLGIAVLGTALHGRLFYLAGTGVPVGAAAALVFAGSLAVYLGLWAGRVWISALTGMVAYALVGLLAMGTDDMVVLTGSEPEGPRSALAGDIWIYGLAAVTVAAVVLCWAVLRREAARQR